MQKGIKSGRDIYSWLPVTGSMTGYEPMPERNNIYLHSGSGSSPVWFDKFPTQMLNSLYGYMDSPPGLARINHNSCTGVTTYNNFNIGLGKTPIIGNPKDDAQYWGLIDFKEAGSGCGNNLAYAGNGIFAFVSTIGCTCNMAMFRVTCGMVSTDDDEPWINYRNARSHQTIQELPVKKVGVNLGAVGDRYLTDEQMLWTHHPAVGRVTEARTLIPVTYRGDAKNVYHHSALMEQRSVGDHGWVAASQVIGMDGLTVHLADPLVALKTAVPPTLDGILNDVCWDGKGMACMTQPATSGRDSTGKGLSGYFYKIDCNDGSYVMLRYDDDNLYVAGGFRGSIDKPGAELQFSLKRYMKIVLKSRENMAGSLVELLCGEWGKASSGLASGMWQAAYSIPNRDVFMAEMAIPWAALAMVGLWKEQLVMNVDVCRGILNGDNNEDGGDVWTYTNVPNPMPATSLYFSPIYLDTARGPVSTIKSHKVRLYFAEMEDKAAGQRVFDVKLQGQTMLSNLDVVSVAGGIRRELVCEFPNVRIADKLDIDFTRNVGEPMLSGVEIIGAYSDAANLPPVAIITPDVTSGASPLVVLLSARKSYDPDGQIANCEWSFGDGSIANGSFVSHTFTKPGAYPIFLRVTDNNNLTAVATTIITVNSVLGPSSDFVCKIRANGGDYNKLSAWQSAIVSDLTAVGSKVFVVSNCGNYASSNDDGKTVAFTGGGTGLLKHINTANVAYITNCAGTISAGAVICSSGHQFTISDVGSPVGLAIAECYNDWTSGLSDTVTIKDWTVNENHYVKISVPSSERHKGTPFKADGITYSGFTLVNSLNSNYALTLDTSYTRVEGVAFCGSNLSDIGGVYIGKNNKVTISIAKCLFYRASSSTKSSIYEYMGSAQISNTMIIADQGGAGIFVEDSAAISNVTVMNGRGVGVKTTKSASKVTNVLSANNAQGDFSVAGVMSYCASKDGSATGVGSRANQVFIFVNEASNDFHLAVSDVGARNFGTMTVFTDPVLSVTDDIDGEFRLDDKPDIGADETSGGETSYKITVVAGANGSISPSGVVVVNSGANQSFTITPNISYKVVDVTVDGLSKGAINNYAFTNVTAHHYISATFAFVAAPIITTQPANQMVTVGQTATFSVVASGVAPIFYQWRKNGANITGATSTSYTTPATVLGDSSTLFSVVVTNIAGSSVTSNNAMLTVTATAVAPTIITQPANTMVTVGQTATFSVVASGTMPLIYQWRKNGANITGATSASYTTPVTVIGDNGALFSVVVTNSANSVTSANATLTVNSPPVLISGPTVTLNPAIVEQTVACFAAATDADGDTLIYTWDFGDFTIGAGSSVTHIYMATGVYIATVTVNDSHGGITTGSIQVIVMAAVAPTITTQPVNTTVFVGQTATFNVVASGTAPLTYQWRKNSANIAGATGSSYTTPATVLGDNGAQFNVMVTNAASNVTSNNVTLTVTDLAAPTITTQPANVTTTIGQTVTFSVVASSGTPLSYQWRRNGANIAGAIGSSYTTPATVAADNGVLFSVVVTNASSSVTSDNAQITLPYNSKSPLIFDFGSTSSVVTVGQQANFYVSVSGATPFSYQWRKNGESIPGATASIYNIPVTVLADNGTKYSVFVTNAYGSAFSGDTILKVQAAAVKPTITSAQNGITTVNTPYTYTITALGTMPITYSAKNLPTGLSISNGGVISGTPTIVGVFTISLIAGNTAGQDTKTLMLTVQPVMPVINTQPKNATVTVGQTATFSVIGDGAAQLTYQWRKNGANIAGATSFSYTTPATVFDDNGATFSVVVTNSVGNVISNNATLTVNVTYTLTVTNGTGSGSYVAGTVVNIAANAPATGKIFDKWTGSTDWIINVNDASTTIYMPAANTTVTATYKDAPPATYTLTVVSGTGSGTYTAGTVVNIAANAPATGKVFDQWTGATVANTTAASTTLTMPAADTTVTAIYKDAQGATPVITSTLATFGTVGQTFNYTITATGTTPITFAATLLPAGLTLSGATISGTPTAAGATSVALTATNAVGSDNKTFVITIAAAPVTKYTLTVVNGTGGGSYTAGTVVNIAANAPATGKVFDAWTGATVANATASSTTLTMPAANTTVTATYKDAPPPPPTQYTLTVVSGTGSGSYTAGAVVSITANTPVAGKIFDAWTGATVVLL